MGKYIIDTDEWANLFEVQKVGVYGIGNDIVTDEKSVWSRMLRLDELEELNSDYISENFGSLQEEAYQRGLEDGKWKAEDGCDGCKYYEDTSLTNPCSECSRGHVDHYKPASDPDPVKVGDKVIVPSDSHVEPGKILSIVNGVCYIMWEDKTVSAYRIDGVRCVK